MYANKLVTTRRAIENKDTSRSQVMEPGASNNPPDPHWGILFVALWWRGFKALLSQYVPFSLIDVGRVSSAYVAHSEVVTSGIWASMATSSDVSGWRVSFMRSTLLMIISRCHVGMISVWGLVGWKTKVTLLQMAHAVIRSHILLTFIKATDAHGDYLKVLLKGLLAHMMHREHKNFGQDSGQVRRERRGLQGGGQIVQEAPVTLMGGIFDVSEGLCVELATKVFGDEDNSRCVGRAACQLFYKPPVDLTLLEVIT
eukprot:1145147-Pelagomonas_calceolata.AAC.3